MKKLILSLNVLKKSFLFLVVCLSLSVVGNAQTKKSVRKTPQTTRTTQPVAKTPAPPSANGKFKLDSKVNGIYNDTDGKDFVIITAEGKSASDIKSSIISTLSSMYTNPSNVISTLGDNIINVTAYASDAFIKPFGDTNMYYSFTYNIKIEIKDGKIKVDSPSFSNITERSVFMGQTLDISRIDTIKMYMELFLARAKGQAKDFENIFNSHITKIVSGLSSNSDW